jgi:hypothetical protein
MHNFFLPWKFSLKHCNTEEIFSLAQTYDTLCAVTSQMKKMAKFEVERNHLPQGESDNLSRDI